MLDRFYLNRWRTPDHISAEDLVAYLDGELSKKASQAAEAHLKTCWDCRARRNRAEQAITEFVRRRSACYEQPAAAPPKNWREFSARLDQLAGEHPWPSRASRFRGWIRLRRPLILKAACAGIACAGVFLWLTGPVATVSAREVLARVDASESRLLSGDAPAVLHQKIKLRRTVGSARAEETTVELWSGGHTRRVAERDGDRLYREFSEVMQANHLADLPPVSGKTFRRWRASVPVRDERATPVTLPTGLPGVAIATNATGPFSDRQIMAGELMVRTRDWHALVQRWRVKAGSQIQEYEVSQLTSEVLAAGSLPSAPPVLSPEPERPAVPAMPAPPSTPAVLADSRDAESLEMDARYAIHRLRACLTGETQVIRQPSGEIVVRGITGSAEQKNELLSALPRSPSLRVDVKSPGEAAESVAADAAPVEVTAPPLGGGIATMQMLRQQQLTGEQIVRLANELGDFSRAARQQAWALRRLAERYGPKEVDALPAPARRKLERMLSDHLVALGRQLERGHALLNPVLGESSPGPVEGEEAASAWQPNLLSLASSVEKTDVLIQQLFTVSGLPAERVGSEMRELQAALVRMDREFQQIEQHLALVMPERGRQ